MIFFFFFFISNHKFCFSGVIKNRADVLSSQKLGRDLELIEISASAKMVEEEPFCERVVGEILADDALSFLEKEWSARLDVWNAASLEDDQGADKTPG